MAVGPLPVAALTGPYGNLHFDAGTHRMFLAVNLQFVDRVSKVLSPPDGGLVIIHDYHL